MECHVVEKKRFVVNINRAKGVDGRCDMNHPTSMAFYRVSCH